MPRSTQELTPKAHPCDLGEVLRKQIRNGVMCAYNSVRITNQEWGDLLSISKNVVPFLAELWRVGRYAPSIQELTLKPTLGTVN